MKSKFFLKILFLSAVLLSCKTKEKESSTNVTSMTPLIEVAQKKFPGITQTDLNEGESILKNDCSGCHGSPKIKSRDEEGWKKVVDWMAPKAKLNDNQKQKLLQFVLSAREQKK